MSTTRVVDRAETGGHLLALWTLVPALLSFASTAAAQEPFNPAGYFYSKQAAALGVDRVTVARFEDDALVRPAGLCTKRGVLHRFASLNTDPRFDSRGRGWYAFEFKTAVVGGVSYSFLGRFINEHVYEQDVTNPQEVVAAGALSLYRDGRLQGTVSVKWTYLPKPRESMGDVNAQYPSGRTDLMYAVLKGDLARTRALLAKGADAEKASRAGETALLCAFDSRGSVVAELDALIAAGADVNRHTQFLARDTTPLLFAVGQGDDELPAVQRLLAAGADVNAAGEEGWTPLMDAVRFGKQWRAIMKTLLRAGADVNARDSQGRTALSFAREAHDAEAVALLVAAGAK